MGIARATINDQGQVLKWCPVCKTYRWATQQGDEWCCEQGHIMQDWATKLLYRRVG